MHKYFVLNFVPYILLLIFTLNINELNKKAGINFNIDVNRPPKTEEWSCSLKFMGNDEAAENNSDLCLFPERYADERESLEQGFSNEDRFNHWFETEL